MTQVRLPLSEEKQNSTSQVSATTANPITTVLHREKIKLRKGIMYVILWCELWMTRRIVSNLIYQRKCYNIDWLVAQSVLMVCLSDVQRSAFAGLKGE